MDASGEGEHPQQDEPDDVATQHSVQYCIGGGRSAHRRCLHVFREIVQVGIPFTQLTTKRKSCVAGTLAPAGPMAATLVGGRGRPPRGLGEPLHKRLLR